MSIKEMLEKGKSHERELFVALLVILTAVLAFGLGRLSKIEGCREPVQIENATTV
jgi:hypothetical protein